MKLPPDKSKYAEEFATNNDLPADAYPLLFSILSTFQLKDDALDDLFNNNYTKSHMSRTTFHGGEQLACYDGRIYVPQKLRKNIVTWYHEYLCHTCETRTEETIKQYLWWPGMTNNIHQYVSKCTTCQLGKNKRLKYGKIPPKEAETRPWSQLCVDTVGPYRV